MRPGSIPVPGHIRRRSAAAMPDLSDLPPEHDAHAVPRRPGRPRLGVVAREITLLPGHWEWLARQPGGASGTLRQLVEAARHDDE
jgi:hypothetical protein